MKKELISKNIFDLPFFGIGGNVYTIKKGDTLSTIAAKNKVSLNRLIKENNITNPDLIQINQTLRIPVDAGNNKLNNSDNISTVPNNKNNKGELKKVISTSGSTVKNNKPKVTTPASSEANRRVTIDDRNALYKLFNLNENAVKQFDLPNDVYNEYQSRLETNKQKKFGIVSKRNAKAYFFDETGNLVVQDEVGLGKDKGEQQPVFYKVKTTPSGVYTMSKAKVSTTVADNFKNGYGSNNFFYLDNQDVNKRLIDAPGSTRKITPRQAVHGIPTNLLKDRLPAFGNNRTDDNYMSAGCINCRKEFLDSPYFNAFDSGNVYVLPEERDGGQMIRRADGSYSQRGLWDNIRANKGSGKKPTQEMLEQERKIKNSEMGGSTFSGNAWYGGGGETIHMQSVFPTNSASSTYVKKPEVKIPLSETKKIEKRQQENQQEKLNAFLKSARKKIEQNYKDIDSLAKDGVHPFEMYKRGAENQQLLEILSRENPKLVDKELKNLKKTGKLMMATGSYLFPEAAPIFNLFNNGADVVDFVKQPSKDNANVVGLDFLSMLPGSTRSKYNPFTVAGDFIDIQNAISEKKNGGSTFSGNAWYDEGGPAEIDWAAIQKKYNDQADASMIGPAPDPVTATAPVSFQQDAINKGIIQAPVSSSDADQKAYNADPKMALNYDVSLLSAGDPNYNKWLNSKYNTTVKPLTREEYFKEKTDRLADGLMDQTFGNPWSLYNIAGFANNIVGGINNRRDRKDAERRERDNYSTMGLYPAMAPGMMSRGIRPVSGTMRNMDFPNQIGGNHSFQGMQQNYYTPFQTAEMGTSVFSDYAPGEMMSEFVPDYTPSLTPVAKDIKENYTVPEINSTTGMNVEEADANLKEFIAQKESGGNYKALPMHNGKLVSSAAGKYQFLWNTHKNAIGTVTGVKTKDEFLNSPEAQEKYMDYWDKTVLTPTAQKIKAAGVNAPMEKIKYMVHFAGPKGAMDYFLHGKETTDGFGMTTSKQASRMNIPTSSYGGAVEMNEQQIMNFLAMGGEIEYVED